MHFRKHLLTAAVALGTALTGSALDIRINLGTNGPEGNWTNITNSTGTFPVIDFDTGEDTGATASSLFPAMGGGNGSGAVVEDWLIDVALASNGGSNFNGGSVTVNGLPAGTYKVEVVASREFDVYGGEYTVNTVAPDTTYRGLTPPTVWEENSDGRNPLDWQIWSAATVGSDGKMTILARIAGGNSWVGINAIRITGAGSGSGGNGGGSGDSGSGTGGNSGGDNTTPTSAMSNLSVRSVAGSGDSTLVVGYAVAGGDKSVLIRGIGPTLASYDVAGALTDARLRMFDSTQTQLASNTNWGGDAAIATAATAVGAFALDAASLDAALLSTNGPGSYSVHVESAGGSGVALAEIYDTDFGTGGYLSNVSARAGVGTGDGVLIVGLVVSGDDPVTVLIRGVGPTLSDYGVGGVLADPELKLFRQGSTDPIQTNDNWGGSTELSSAFSTAGAFDLTATDSTDAAMLVELTAGVYSAQVSGVGGSTGVALVELYIMP